MPYWPAAVANLFMQSPSYSRLEEQPIDTDFVMPDGVFIKQIHIKKKGTYIPQHSHSYEHVSMLARGSVQVWINGELDRRTACGTYKAPKPIMISAEKKHLFLALEDDTIIFCIHNISRTGEIEVREEHQITP